MIPSVESLERAASSIQEDEAYFVKQKMPEEIGIMTYTYMNTAKSIILQQIGDDPNDLAEEIAKKELAGRITQLELQKRKEVVDQIPVFVAKNDKEIRVVQKIITELHKENDELRERIEGLEKNVFKTALLAIAGTIISLAGSIFTFFGFFS